MNNLFNQPSYDDLDEREAQELDDQARQMELLDALWAVHHSGLEEEAVILAYGCGLGKQWKDEHNAI